jgi:hypothetical protein
MKVSCSDFALLEYEPGIFTTTVSCNTFALLVCEPITSTHNTSSFNNKSSSTFQVVVVRGDWISKATSNKIHSAFRMLAHEHQRLIKNQPIFS